MGGLFFKKDSLTKTCQCFIRYLIVLYAICLDSCDKKSNNNILFNADQLTKVNVEKVNLRSEASPGIFTITSPNAMLTFRPVQGVWDLNQFIFVDCKVENLSNNTQLVELLLNEDSWAMGGVYIGPGEKKIVRSVIMRQKFSQKQLSQFPGMNGLPDGSIKLWWQSYEPDSIKAISLFFPLSKSGDRIKVGSVFVTGKFKVLTDEEYQAFLPIIDKFGQYIHKDWPGKIKNIEDLFLCDKNEIDDLNANPGYAEMSIYGGWKNGPKLKATGHFRVEKYQRRWTFVDPEGYLFWSHGIDCVQMESATPVEGREKLFSYLPDSIGVFRDFISREKVGSTYTPEFTACTNTNMIKFVNFYGMNLKRKWGNDYQTKFVNRTLQRLKSWEINTIANWSSQAIYGQHQIPYFISVNTAQERMLNDPFDPNFKKAIEDQLIRFNRDALNDPWCIGIFVDNEIHWGNEQFLGSLVLTTNKYPFAKKSMVNYLKKKYKLLSALNQTWESDFKSWNELIENTELFTNAKDDIRLISGLVAKKYFRQCKNALKEVAPEKLYLGCRFDFHFYPEKDTLAREWVIPYAEKYADVVSFNRYNYSCNTMKPGETMDFPIIIGEFHVGALDRGLPHGGLRQTTNQKERAFIYKNFLLQAIKNPYVIGVGWFQYLDQPYTGRFDGENYQIGFLSVGDCPYEELIKSAREVGRSMYSLRFR